MRLLHLFHLADIHGKALFYNFPAYTIAFKENTLYFLFVYSHKLQRTVFQSLVKFFFWYLLRFCLSRYSLIPPQLWSPTYWITSSFRKSARSSLFRQAFPGMGFPFWPYGLKCSQTKLKNIRLHVVRLLGPPMKCPHRSFSSGSVHRAFHLPLPVFLHCIASVIAAFCRAP